MSSWKGNTTSERQPLLAHPKVQNANTQHQPPTLNQLSKAKLCCVLTAIGTAIFLSALDGTIVATLQQPISNDFGQSHKASYIGTSYLLSICCFTPLYGRLSDILGRKGALLLALSFFTLGTLGCGLASSMGTFIASRFLAGMGGGGIMTVSSIVLSDLIPLRDRGLMHGIMAIVSGTGAGLGGPLGGYLFDHCGRRTAFLIQIPALVGAFILVSIHVNIVLPKPKVPLTLKQKLRRIDWLGSFTLIMFVGSLLLGFSLKVTEELEWKDSRVWGLLLNSVIFLICFIGVEVKVSSGPILPMGLLLTRTPLSVALTNFFCSFVSFSMIYNVPLYFMAVRLQTASQAGTHLLPNSVAWSTGSVVAGLVMRRTGKYWGLIVISTAFLLLSTMLIARWDRDYPSDFDLWFDIVPNGLGVPSTVASTLVAMIACISRADMPVAIGITYLFRTTGHVLGVSLSGTLFQAVLLKKLRESMPGPNASSIIEMIRHDASLVRTLGGGQKEAAMQSFAQALRAVFICQAIAAFMALLCTLPIEERPLPGTHEEHQKDHEQRQNSSQSGSRSA